MNNDPILTLIIQVAASLTGVRLLLNLLSTAVDAAVAQSSSQNDDTVWAKVRTSFPYLLLSSLLEGISGAGLPGTEPKK